MEIFCQRQNTHVQVSQANQLLAYCLIKKRNSKAEKIINRIAYRQQG